MPQMKPRNAAEKRLLAGARKGTIANVSKLKDKTIRATFLRDICLRPDDYGVHEKGVRLNGAEVLGQLDFEAVTLPRPFWLYHCALTEELVLRDAETHILGLTDCMLNGIEGDRLRVKGNLTLKGTTVSGEVRFLGAHVEGNLESSGATFDNPADDAFSADGANLAGDLVFQAATALGTVRLLGAKIGGDVSGSNATFDNQDKNTFCADGIEIGGTLFLRHTKISGVTRLVRADINHDLACDGGTFDNPNIIALALDGIKVGGTLSLKDIKVRGETRAGHAANGCRQIGRLSRLPPTLCEKTSERQAMAKSVAVVVYRRVDPIRIRALAYRTADYFGAAIRRRNFFLGPSCRIHGSHKGAGLSCRLLSQGLRGLDKARAIMDQLKRRGATPTAGLSGVQFPGICHRYLFPHRRPSSRGLLEPAFRGLRRGGSSEASSGSTSFPAGC